MIVGSAFRSPFVARDLAVAIAGAVTFGPATDAQTARQQLHEHKFDQAPVLDEGRVIGFVLARRIEDRHLSVAEVMVPLGSGSVVSADAGVGDLLEWILVPGFLFVLEGRDVTGFITIHDFNKQPARGHLYLLLTRLESALAGLIRSHYGLEIRGSLVHLSERSRRQIELLYAADLASDVESDLVSYFSFSDVVAVVEGEDRLRNRIGQMSRTGWRRDIGGLVELRNQVMHPVRNVILTKEGLVRLHERERRIRRLIGLVEAAQGEVPA